LILLGTNIVPVKRIVIRWYRNKLRINAAAQPKQAVFLPVCGGLSSKNLLVNRSRSQKDVTMAAHTQSPQVADTLLLARMARARRDAYVGEMLRRAFATLFSRKPRRQLSDDWGTALSPLGAR
jgi:hypothetical protein